MWAVVAGFAAIALGLFCTHPRGAAWAARYNREHAGRGTEHSAPRTVGGMRRAGVFMVAVGAFIVVVGAMSDGSDSRSSTVTPVLAAAVVALAVISWLGEAWWRRRKR